MPAVNLFALFMHRKTAAARKIKIQGEIHMKNVFSVLAALMSAVFMITSAAAVSAVPEKNANKAAYTDSAELYESVNILLNCDIIGYSDIGQTGNRIEKINDGIMQNGSASDDNRWQASSRADHYLIFDLGTVCRVSDTKIAFFYYTQRTSGYRVYLSGLPFDTADMLSDIAADTVKDTSGTILLPIVDRRNNTEKGLHSDTLSESAYGRYVLLAVAPPTGNVGTASSPGVLEFEVYGEKNAHQAKINDKSIFVETGEQKSISYTIVTDGSLASDFIWKSSDETVASVNGGVVTGISTGNAEIMLSNANGDILGTCDVSVDIRKPLSLNKPVVDYDDYGVLSEAGTGYKNTVENLTNGEKPDGNFNFPRWHVSDRETHYAVIDLEEYCLIEETDLYFFYYNVRAYGYRIDVSADGKNFETVTDNLNNRTTGVCKEIFDGGVYGRYVRVYVTAPTAGAGQNSTAGVYEIEIYGKPAPEAEKHLSAVYDAGTVTVSADPGYFEIRDCRIAAAAYAKDGRLAGVSLAEYSSDTALNTAFSVSETPENIKLFFFENGQNLRPVRKPYTAEITETQHVDLVLFMGQSNMAGRGNADEASVCTNGHAYEFRAVSDPTRLYPVTEPFGASEDDSSNILYDNGRKSGSLVSSFCETYYGLTGRRIVAVSASKGGTTTTFWKSGGSALNEALSRYGKAKKYLESNGFVIDNTLVLWYQGCSDADEKRSAADYTSATLEIFRTLLDSGADAVGVIQIGNYIDTDRYVYIQEAQSALCTKDASDGIVLVSTLPKTCERKSDGIHLTQNSYNAVGADAAANFASYLETGIE